jgi:hypothetical protein
VSEVKTGNLFRTLRRARVWIILQFGLTLLLILLGVAWTRLPEKHLWQVALSLLLQLILAISALELQAGTVRAFAEDDGRRVKLVWGAITLLVWIALGWAAWTLLDWCDDQIPLWVGYLNSGSSAQAKATLFTYQHIVRWLAMLEWLLRWIVLPAKLIPFAAASAQWGLRLPWGRIIRLLWNWRWWLGVALAALAGVWLPSQFVKGTPSGTVSALVWIEGFKLAAAYLLAVGSWITLLAWWAVLFGRPDEPPTEEALVAVPVLAGPPDRKLKAKAEVPPVDEVQ